MTKRGYFSEPSAPVFASLRVAGRNRPIRIGCCSTLSPFGGHALRMAPVSTGEGRATKRVRWSVPGLRADSIRSLGTGGLASSVGCAPKEATPLAMGLVIAETLSGTTRLGAERGQWKPIAGGV